MGVHKLAEADFVPDGVELVDGVDSYSYRLVLSVPYLAQRYCRGGRTSVVGLILCSIA